MTVFRAIAPFAFVGKNGVPRVVTPGVLMSDDDPDFKGKESFFESVEVAAARPGKQASGMTGPHFPEQEWIDTLPNMEDATAEPNTKRSVSTVRAKHPAKSEAEKKSEDETTTSDMKE
jgi:hypothetical protein